MNSFGSRRTLRERHLGDNLGQAMLRKYLRKLGSRVDAAEANDRRSTQRRRCRGGIGHMEQKRALSAFIRRRGFEVAPPADRPCRASGRMKNDARKHRSHGMHLKLEGNDDAKVAAAAHRPKKIVVLARADGDEAAIGKHHVGGEQVVKCETMFAHEPA